MKTTFLDFEQSIAELEGKIEELRFVQDDSALDISEEIKRLSKKSQKLTEDTYSKLSSWQISQVARHPQRPYSLDYLKGLFGEPVMVIGHQKGRDIKERQHRNFGMPRPEGYRKALRLMRMAEKFQIPILTFIDTPGAYPGIGAEERGQSEAIARNLYVMAELKTPIICTIIGEGGSGGALAIGVGDRTLILQYSTYSVISPEGCASILWKSADKASVAAETLGITAERLLSLELVDKIVPEPLGGAHRDWDGMFGNLRRVLGESLAEMRSQPLDALLGKRYERLMAYGRYKEDKPA